MSVHPTHKLVGHLFTERIDSGEQKHLFGECPRHLAERSSLPRNGKGHSDCLACILEAHLADIDERYRGVVDDLNDRCLPLINRLQEYVQGCACYCLPYLPCSRCIALYGRAAALEKSKP